MTEVMAPELRRVPPGETVRTFTVTPAHLGLDEYEVASQGPVSHHSARTPFTGDSTQHVSVWERVDQGMGAPTARMSYPRAGS